MLLDPLVDLKLCIERPLCFAVLHKFEREEQSATLSTDVIVAGKALAQSLLDATIAQTLASRLSF